MPIKIKLKYLILTTLATILVGLSLLFISYKFLANWGKTVTHISSPKEIELKRGMPLRKLAKTLEKQELIDSSLLFEAWVRVFSGYQGFQAGSYRFEGAVSPLSITEDIKAGKVYQPVLYELTIPEGYTIAQIAQKLAELNICRSEQFIKTTSDPDILSSFSIPATNLEGYLYPATYPFIYKPTPEEVTKLLVTTFFSKLPNNYTEQAAEKGLTLHQAVTFASLIEKETKLDSEREMVSEVIWNRLAKGMTLGIDASIIYGIKDYNGNIRRSHLNDHTNLYNSRIHGGLPPGPIASPATASLLAVLNPTNFGYYYYVVNADDMVSHKFSSTLREHNQNVAEYLRGLKIRGINQ